ncbi:purple acid phosphatase family protein [Adhaeretor mobilis]|uniref:purple acid phosphatase family protein n=1 Tax=Adhaeretor mobilis TaxID=1930276 RepID=UPI001FE3ECEB|nr:metallophosphoesterase family protein [Adhaeretor mobilis]
MTTRKWIFLPALLLAGTYFLPGPIAEDGIAAEEQTVDLVPGPQQWRCIWTTDPSTTALISWNTTVPGKQHRVHYRQLLEAEEQTPLISKAERDGKYSGRGLDLYYHHVKLSDLQPDATYEVVMESDGRRSPALKFKTAPSEDRPLAVIFGADSRSGLKERRQMNAMLARMLAESQQEGRTPIIAFAHGGDYVLNGTDLPQWSQWMTDHELTTTADGLMLPIIPARGNHDHGPLFNEIFGFPPKDKDYYAIDVGPQIRWITLNSETSVAGDQSKWLDKELAASRPKYRWIVPQYHRPAFPAVKVPGRALVHWVPLFEKHDVDLVCEGDGHNIKRTPPIRNNVIDPTGVVYIGEGGLGVGQRAPKMDRWYLRPPEAKAGEGHHVQLLSFDAESITYRVVLLDEGDGSKIFDEHHFAVRAPKKDEK